MEITTLGTFGFNIIGGKEMKAGIFETEHFEGSYPVIKLFDHNNNEITVFTYEEAYRQFRHLFPEEPRRYEWKNKAG